VGHVLDRLDPDQEEQRARELFAVPAMEDPTEDQRQQARTQLLDEAAEPLASNPQLSQALLTVRQAQEITVDVLTADKLTSPERGRTRTSTTKPPPRISPVNLRPTAVKTATSWTP
jgi:hypothetical protein